MAVTSKLNARQAEFVRHYTTGADGVRGNATQAFIAAGYSPKGANKMAARLLANAGVQRAIAGVHETAEAAATNKLRDWKEMAPAAQERIEQLGRGALPDGADAQAVPATVMLAANREIIERGYPSKQTLDHNHRIDGRLQVTVLYEEQSDHGAEASE